MSHTIGVEHLPCGPAVLWLLDLAGCAVEIEPGDPFFARAGERAESYLAWREGYHYDAAMLSDEPDEMPDLVEPVQAAESRLHRAFFEADRSPLSSDDAFEIGWLLNLSHRELVNVVQLTSSQLMATEPLAEPWLGRKQELEHLIHLEQRQLQALGEEPQLVESTSIVVTLTEVRRITLDLLPALVDKVAAEYDGEWFSGRKMARLLIHHDLEAVRSLRMVAARG